jgi:hypothetical protein
MRRDLGAQQQHRSGRRDLMSYVEFPTDLIVGVHWKRKKPPNGGNGDGELVQGPCGMVGEYPSQPGRQFYLLDNFGPWAIGGGLGQDGQKYVTGTSNLRLSGGQYFSDYGWQNPNGYTVSARAALEGYSSFGVLAWLNADITSFNPCTDPPDQTGGATLDIGPRPQGGPPVDQYYGPIFGVCDPQFGSACGYAPVYFTVQAHCADETGGGLPPQPPGFPLTGPDGVRIFGPMKPSSGWWNAPGLPP